MTVITLPADQAKLLLDGTRDVVVWPVDIPPTTRCKTYGVTHLGGRQHGVGHCEHRPPCDRGTVPTVVTIAVECEACGGTGAVADGWPCRNESDDISGSGRRPVGVATVTASLLIRDYADDLVADTVTVSAKGAVHRQSLGRDGKTIVWTDIRLRVVGKPIPDQYAIFLTDARTA